VKASARGSNFANEAQDRRFRHAGQPGMSPNSAASRYSPGRVKSVSRIPRIGMPITANISTAYMERWNLTLRMQNRRFTRLTNAFSKKFGNHRHMIAMTVVFYNFCKSHKSLAGKTPPKRRPEGAATCTR